MASTRTLLSIAPNLKLPEEAVTETFAILGKRGSGKTTTARVLTEELLHVGLPALILDQSWIPPACGGAYRHLPTATATATP
jgi:ABC-type glutathione transport system ATPase component